MIKLDLEKLIVCGLDLEHNIDLFLNQPSVEAEEVITATTVGVVAAIAAFMAIVATVAMRAAAVVVVEALIVIATR